MSKVIWIDTETLSFNPDRCDIIQLAGLIEIDGKIVEKFNWFISPEEFDDENNIVDIWKFHEEHLGYTKEQILNDFKPAKEVYLEFVSILGKYCDKFNKHDKFILGGFNVQFDLNKLNSFFKYFGDNYLFSYISSIKYDPLYIVPFIINDYPFDKMKLFLMWDYLVELGMPKFEIKQNDHDARTDIMQTYWIWKKICESAKQAFIN